MKIDLEYLNGLVGKEIETLCPKCSSKVLENMHGCLWCPKPDCDWSSDPKMVVFFHTIGKGNK